MLMDQAWRYRFSEFDQQLFDAILPQEHLLIDVDRVIDWPSFDSILREFYSPDRGHPGISPVIMLKLEFLRYMYNLSDRQVMERSDTDMAFRWFLKVPIRFQLPHASLLSKFRGRLGTDGFKRVFNQLVVLARQSGLVKDRLRLKDTTHVIANIAVPPVIKLIAQVRDRLLKDLESIDPELATGFRVAVESLRESCKGATVAIQLEQRVELLTDVVQAVAELAIPVDVETNVAWHNLRETLAVAQKILYDQAHPQEGRRTVSIVDSEARRGLHGDWYDGYVVDVMMDADSELITQIQVLEAGSDEAKSAVELIRNEQSTHGNKIEQFSIDGAGFNGKLLRACEELDVAVIVPPKPIPQSSVFPNTDFVISEDGKTVTCPAGERSSYAQDDKHKNGTIFRFKRQQCDNCPLVKQCMRKPGTGLFGRSVQKNDYQAEYDRARAKAETDEYKAVRREHPAIERKLNEIANHHHGRRARYWTRAKVAAQQFMTAFTVNAKRMTKLPTEELRTVTA
jgi:transposase